MPKSIDEVAGEIMNEMEKLLLERVYIAILREGSVLYASTALDKHIELLKLFVITEFKQMNNFDHHFPLPGTNLAIFNIENILVALYTKKGYQGQLLSFKTKIKKFSKDLKIAIELPTTRPIQTEQKEQILPKMTQTVSLTLGLSDDESAVLKLCDGNHSIREIVVKTRIPRKNVIDIIRRYENKDWLQLDFRGDIEIIPISIKKFPETAVRLGMISKKSLEINKLCDGINNIQDIATKLEISEKELRKILGKMEKNEVIRMSVKIPEERPRISEVPSEKAEALTAEEISNPELYVKPNLAENISLTVGFNEKEKQVLKLLDGSHSIVDLYHVTQIPITEIFQIIFEYEEKGWIRIPIDDFKKIVIVKEKLKEEFRLRELKAEYQSLFGEPAVTSDEALEIAEKVLEEPPSLVSKETLEVEDALEREALLQQIQEELPLMPPSALNKLVDKLIQISPRSREGMLNKLLYSESSKKFKKPVEPQPSAPVSVSEPAPMPSQTEPIKGVFDESPLLRPSELLKVSLSLESEAPSQPAIPQPPSPIEIKKPKEETQPVSTQTIPSEPTPAPELIEEGITIEEGQVTEVLNFIDSLLGIPEILYIALIDYGGTIFYQTTKESTLWDISKDTLKFIQNWKAQAPSIYLGDKIKYAVIKTEPEMLIATNIKGIGHVVTIPINDKLFILTKVSKEGDALLIADDVSIVAKQINEMFQGF